MTYIHLQDQEGGEPFKGWGRVLQTEAVAMRQLQLLRRQRRAGRAAPLLADPCSRSPEPGAGVGVLACKGEGLPMSRNR